MDAAFWWDWWVKFAAALGTFLAVAVALFGPWLKAKVFPPKLVLSLVDPDGEFTHSLYEFQSAILEKKVIPTRWYHLRVENQARLTPATQVQVNLLRVEEPDAAGQAVEVWSGVVPLKWKNQQHRPLTPTVGAPVDCDLFSLAKGHWLQLQPVFVPFNLPVQKAGQCRLFLTVQATSVEVDSNVIRLEVSWDGQWSDEKEAMRRHLVFRGG